MAVVERVCIIDPLLSPSCPLCPLFLFPSPLSSVLTSPQADMDRSSDALASLLVKVSNSDDGGGGNKGELQWPPRDSSVIARLEEVGGRACWLGW